MEIRKNGERGKERATWPSYLLCLLIAYVLTGALLLVLAFLLWKLRLSEQAAYAGMILIYVSSTFLAGFLAGKRAQRRKFLWGLLMGTGYFLILVAASVLTSSDVSGMNYFPVFFLCAGGGMLGGMLC